MVKSTMYVYTFLMGVVITTLAACYHETEVITHSNIDDLLHLNNPTHVINVVEHLCINTNCEESWDKSRAERGLDGTERSYFTPDVANSTLHYLCPVRSANYGNHWDFPPTIDTLSEIDNVDGNLFLSATLSADNRRPREIRDSDPAAYKQWGPSPLYKTPKGWTIARYDDDRSVTDSNFVQGIETPSIRGGTLLSEVEIMGNTGDGDLGNCTDDDTYMSLTYNPVRIKLSPINPRLERLIIPYHIWKSSLIAKLGNSKFRLHNYDQDRGQQSGLDGHSERAYFIDWTSLTPSSQHQIQEGSYYWFHSRGLGERIAIRSDMIRGGPYTFLLNDINSNRLNPAVGVTGNHIKITIHFESRGVEIAAACENDPNCGFGGLPHEDGKPIVEANNLKFTSYFQLEVNTDDNTLLEMPIIAKTTRVYVDADFQETGLCANMFNSYMCGEAAKQFDTFRKVIHKGLNEQANGIMDFGSILKNHMEKPLSDTLCSIVEYHGKDCRNLNNLIFAENGDLLVFFDG